MRLRRIAALTIVAAMTLAGPVYASDAARDMYARVLAQERSARDDSNKATVQDMRRIVTRYEQIVRKHRASGYADNALWQAANLAELAYERFNQDADRQTATRLYKQLTTDYPTSKLVPRALAALEDFRLKAEATGSQGTETGSQGTETGSQGTETRSRGRETGSPAAETGSQAPPATGTAGIVPQGAERATTADTTTPPAVAAPHRRTSSPETRTSIPDSRSSTLGPRSSTPESRTSNLEPRTASLGPRSSTPESRTSNLEPRASTPGPRPSDPEPRPSVVASRPSGAVLLKEIHRSLLPDGVRITIDLDSEVAYHQEELERPRRVFFDLKGVRTVPALQDTTLKFDDDVVKEIRLGRHPQNTTRIVLDMEGVEGYTVYPLYGPYRLVIDFRRAAATKVTGATPPPVVASLPAAPPATASNPVPTPPPPIAPAILDPEPLKMPLASKQAAPLTVPPAAPSANSNGKFSLSRQLGLGVSRIVIDAGHGGHDPGAQASGVNESEVTLDVALRLQKLLQKQPGVDVVMTRDTDVFIPLQERTAIANREGADLFLSIHVNASRNPLARGIETYFLNFAMNPEAEAVAARENAGSGQAMHSLPDIVKAIALNNKINESRDFAATVQRSMIRKVRVRNKTVKDLGVKQAPFVVLIGAGMPSVLAEISFVTNKQEGALLKSGPYRQQIAQALLDAVLSYQQGLKKMNAISGKKATED